jgi:putative ABC transport system substrate-binding protein
MPTVGVLTPASSTTTQFPKTLLRRMKELGWEEGRNYHVLFRYAEGDIGRFPRFADEFVARHVNVIVALGDPAIEAALRATTTAPIVGMAADMVKQGYAASMSRPGGNVTGLDVQPSEFDVKRLELLHEAIPAAKRIGVLADPAAPSTRPQLEEAARKLDLTLIVADAANPDALAGALDAFASAHLDAVIVPASPFLTTARQLIIKQLNQARLPAIYQYPEAAKEGGLLAYGFRVQVAIQQVAGFVAKILGGALPQDLPVENVDKIDLVLNLKTAKLLGIEIPGSLIAQADEVIE